MKIIVLSSLLLLLSCGQDQTQENQSGQVSANQITGILSIPKPGVLGGGPMVEFQGKGYQISTSSSNQTSWSYITQISNSGTNVQPVRQTSSYTDYNATFSGQIIKESCTFNPMAQCENFKLDSIRIF